jgi:hypothetical protein
MSGKSGPIVKGGESAPPGLAILTEKKMQERCNGWNLRHTIGHLLCTPIMVDSANGDRLLVGAQLSRISALPFFSRRFAPTRCQGSVSEDFRGSDPRDSYPPEVN